MQTRYKDAITIRPSSKLRLWIPTRENYESDDCSIPRKRNISTVTWQHKE